MIELNEIRIGNYFEHDDSWNYAGHKGIFQWSDRDWYALGESTMYLEGIKPIELTEGMLLICGFEVKPLSMGLTFDRFRFIWKETYKYWYVIDRYSQSYYTKIEFVHELQNFVFTLNGKELNIKL